MTIETDLSPSPQNDSEASTENGDHLTLAVPFSSRSTLRSSLIKHGTRGRSPGKKNVSFCSQKEEKRISNVNDCWQYMQNGTELIKLRGNVRQFRRFFSLDADLSHIRWTPTNKKPHRARIAVDQIREIRVGRNTELLRSSETALCDLQEECTFSIIYGEDYTCLDLIANTADDANIWVTGLMALTSGKHECKPSSSTSMATLRERWLESVFDEGDVDEEGFISEKTAVKMIRQINPKIIITRIKNKAKEFGISSIESDRGKITRAEFVEMYKEIATRPEVYFLMVRYANKDYLSCQDLRLFLETEQGMVGVTTDFCENLIEQYEPSPEGKEHSFMTVDGFTSFLLSNDCCVFDPVRTKVWQDMKQPFNRYYIAASHRTYLVEDQQGPASSDGYVSALKRSCRVVDLDIWDPCHEAGETEPMIQQGAATTNKLALGAALRAVRECAFERTRYPLFLRLSLHCDVQWQKEAAKLIKEILSPRLYLPEEDPTDWDDVRNVPTPWDFQTKIIVIGKRIPPNEEETEVSEDDEGFPVTSKRKGRKLAVCREISSLTPKFAQQKVINDLLCTAPNSHTLSPRNHMPTMAEQTSVRLMQTYQPEFMQATRDYAIRVSPNINRVDSSNVNPQEFWNNGVQMVALNYQTPGLMMDLQEGKFSENGGCGYVLKPAIMKDELFVPGDKLPYAPQILHLRILSGQQLPRPRGSNAKGDSADPFVVIEIFGVPSDCAEERTKTIRNDSMNPSFDESFQFQIAVPELALVRFLVLDDDFIGDDFIGQYTVPFDCLQPGYRHIHLLNNEGDPLESASLFVHIAITNRRGGGKAKKRGMSVKRKPQRAQTGMKLVGIKTVDEQFKTAVAPLADSINMRAKLEGAMVDWQEECGLGPAGTIRQGIRLIHSRMITLAVNSTPPSSPSGNDSDRDKSQEPAPTFMVDSDASGPLQYPIVFTSGQIPEQLQRTFTKLKTLITTCVTILVQADKLLVKIEESIKKIQESHDDLSNLCIDAGLRGQKATRAAENFTWNLRLLKAQLNLMNKSQDEAGDIIQQVFDTSAVLGILSDRLTSQRSGRRFSRVIPDPAHDICL